MFRQDQGSASDKAERWDHHSDEVLVQTHVRKTALAGLLIFLPVGMIVFSGFFFGIAINLLRLPESPRLLQACLFLGACSTALLCFWSYATEVQFTLTLSELQIRSLLQETIIPFSTIESIVGGLPPPGCTFMGMAIYGPRDRIDSKLAPYHEAALLVRLPGREFLPLCIGLGYQGGAELMQRFAELNATRFQPQSSYSAAELRRYSRVSFNRVGRL